MATTLRPAHPREMALLVAIDDDACTLYEEAGRGVDVAPDPVFVAAEQARWRESLAAGRVVVAVNDADEPVGFASLGLADAGAHLQQLSVRREWMRRGIGRALLKHAIAWAGDVLWLTTYADIAWNRPYYERFGFVCIDAGRWGPELRRIVEEERRALPAPEQRVVMARGRA